jgi:hypothetical protein
MDDVVGLHPAECSRSPNDETILSVERAKSLMHGLVAISQPIEYIADNRDIEVVANPLEELLV